MATCVNINHPGFLNLVEESGIDPMILEADIGIWMNENNTTNFPTLSQLKTKRGVSEVFKENPELEKIGTEEQYSAYLDTIFPNSKVKDIVYRGGAITEEEFKNRFALPTDYMDLGSGLYLSPQKRVAGEYGIPKANLVNIKNPRPVQEVQDERSAEENFGRDAWQMDDGGKYDGIVDLSQPFKDTYELVVFNENQIYTLGSKQDIERFKEFVNRDISGPTEIFYQTSQARSVKSDLKKIFFDEVRGKNLSESEIQNINSRLLEISRRIGDEDYRLRLSQNGNYYIAGYKNGAVTMDDYYSPYANGIFRQLESKQKEKQNKKLDRVLGTWAKKNGIKVETLQNLRKRFPERFENEALGVSDFLNGLIGLADNRRVDTMAEEISHFAIELLYTSEQYNDVKKVPQELKFLPIGAPFNIREALDNVHLTKTYAEVKEEYKNVYNNEIDFRKEALAKILAAEIVNQFQTAETLAKEEESYNPFWKSFLVAINDFFTWLDNVLGINTAGRNDIELTVLPLAKQILSAEKLANTSMDIVTPRLNTKGRFAESKGWNETDVLYQLNKKPLNYKKKIDTSLDTATKTKKEFLEGARFQLRKRLEEFSQSQTKRNTEALEQQIKELSNKIEKEEFNLGVISFVNEANEELAGVNAKLTDALNPDSDFEFTNDGIARANDYVDMYEGLFKNIKNIALNDDTFSEKDRKEVDGLINNALSAIAEGKQKGTALAVLASKVNLERANTDAYGKTIDPNFNPEEISEQATEDTSKFRLNFGNFKNAKKSIIRLAHKLIFESVSATKRFAAQTAQTLFTTQELFLTKYKQTDLIEKDANGKETGYFARKYKYNDYYQKMSKVRDIIAEKIDLRNEAGEIDSKLLDREALTDSELEIYNKEYELFFKENSVKEKIPVTTQKVNKETGLLETFVKIKKGSNTKFVKESTVEEERSLGWAVFTKQKSVPSNKFLNKEFVEKMKDPVYANHYNNVINKKREAVAKLPPKYRTERTVYMLPSILKSTLDKFFSMADDGSSFLTRIKNMGDEALFIDADDTEFGQLDRFNSQVVPIFFTKPIPVDKLSFDVGRSVVMFSQMAENFRNMNKVAPEIQNLQTAIGDRKYLTNKKEGVKQGTQSTDYATIKNLLEHYVYGIEFKEGDKAQYTFTDDSFLTKAFKKMTGGKIDISGKTISATKIAKQFERYIRTNNLAFNVPTMVTGLLTGTGDKIITAQLGTYTTPKSALWARGEMAKNLPQILMQSGKLSQTNKVHLILQQQQIVQLEKTIGESGRNPLTRKFVNGNPLYAGYTQADYLLKGNATLSIYHNYRVYNNEFITREQFYRIKAAEKGVPFGESNKADKALKKELNEEWAKLEENNLYNAFEVIDGALQVKKEYKDIVSEDLLNSVRGKVEYMTTLLDGTMSETDKGSLSRSALGGFLTMHRGFFFNLVDKKFRREQTNFLTEEEEIGDYRAAGGFIADMTSNLFKKGNLMAAWESYDKLSPAKRRGVKRTLFDFIYLTITGLISSMLLKLADDDDDNEYLNFAALIGTRWALETGVVANLAELQNILDEPVVGVRVTKEILSIYNLIYDNEPYEKGMYEGKTKLTRLGIKLMPFGRKNIYEFQYPKEKLEAMKQIRGSGLLYNEDDEKFDLGKWMLQQLVGGGDYWVKDGEEAEENYDVAVDALSESDEFNSFN